MCQDEVANAREEENPSYLNKQPPECSEGENAYLGEMPTSAAQGNQARN